MQQFTWIYSLSETLTSDHEASLVPALAEIARNWKSHGSPIAGVIQLKYSRFVIVQADPETGRPSGCSIDGLKHKVEELLTSRQISWFDASQIFYLDASGNLAFTHFKHIASMLTQGDLTEDTLVFDHTLSQSDDLNRWEQPLKNTWLKRFLPVETSKQA